MVTLYTRGSALVDSRKRKPGGWSYIVVNEDGKILARDSGLSEDTTRPRMEVYAVIKGLTEARCFSKDVVIRTNSHIVYKVIEEKLLDKWASKNWTRGKRRSLNVSNQDLWLILTGLKTGINVSVTKVRSGGQLNEHDLDNYKSAIGMMRKAAGDSPGAPTQFKRYINSTDRKQQTRYKKLKAKKTGQLDDFLSDRQNNKERQRVLRLIKKG